MKTKLLLAILFLGFGLRLSLKAQQFSSANIAPFSNQFYSKVIDFDNDGDDDVYGWSLFTTNTAKLYRNNGNSTFTDVSIETGFPRLNNGVTADLDKNGFMDLYFRSGDSLKYSLNNGTSFNYPDFECGIIRLSQIFNTPAESIKNFRVADFNNDGVYDVVVHILSGTNSGIYGITGRISCNQCGFSLNSETPKLLASVPNPIDPLFAFADINNDGAFDLLVGNGTKSTPYASGYWNFTNSIYLNNGNGDFVLFPNSGYNVGRSYAFGCLGEFNNDGRVDIISGPADCCEGGPGGSGNINPIYTYFSNSSGGYNTSTTAMTRVTDRKYYIGATVVDINLDRRQDVLWTSIDSYAYSSSILQCYLNNGNNSFTESSASLGINIGSSPTPVLHSSQLSTLIDLNNDKKPDLNIQSFGTYNQASYNNTIKINTTQNNVVKMKMVACTGLKEGWGARIKYKSGGTWSFLQHSGYSGANYPFLYLGMANAGSIDSLVINWVGGNETLLTNISAGSYLVVEESSNCLSTASGIVTPTFDAITQICSNSPLPNLPIISAEGITGNWNLETNNPDTKIYKFTPVAGQCANSTNITITVKQPSASSINATITQGETYSFNGQNLTAAGTYSATLQNASGCDSLITLTLAVNPVQQNCEVIISDNEICAGETVNISIGGYTPSTGTCSSENMPANLQQGLVAWYPFCGNAEDESPNNYNGTVRSAVQTTDRFGNANQAYRFSSGQDIIVNGTQGLNLYPMSISLWYNVDTITSIYDEANIFSKYSNPAAWNGYAIITSNMAPEENNVYYPTVKPWYTRSINNRIIGRYGSAPFEHENITLDSWHHMVFTVSPQGGKCYVNGQLIASDTWDGIAGSTNSNSIWKIGGFYSYWFKGKIDDIAVYNRVLSADEALQLYQHQAQSEATSILWSTGETTSSISVSPSATTSYSVTVTQGTQTCTSDVTITVNQATSSSVNASITQGETYNFNGQNLTLAGTYTATLQNAAGCDSVVTLNLTVNPAPVAGCYATSVVNFNQGSNVLGSAVSDIRSNANQALGQPEAVVTNVVNFVSLGFGGTITVAFETPIANGAGNDIRIDEATWGNKPCNRYPEKADVFASQDGINFIFLGQACQDASFDLGTMSWAKYIRLIDVGDILSFNADADGYDLNGIECLNGTAINPTNDGLVACTLQEIVSYAPGNRKNGTAVPSPRNNANNALGMPQSNNTVNFVALGFGGTLVAKFDYIVFNQPGNDLQVTETSFGNPSCTNFPEKARVSLSLDNLNWVELGELCQDGTIEMGTMPYAQYIRIQDATPMSSNKFNGTSDGYDVDAVVVLNNGCGNTSAKLSQLDNTTTPDDAMTISAFPNPMEDFTVVNFEGLESDSDFNFQIMDAAGRLVRNENIRVSVNNPTYMFDASELARGIYQIVLLNEKGNQIIRLMK